MLQEIFYWIVNMSMIASVYGVIIYFLRYIRSLPRTAVYYLWFVVLLRMLCPVGISSKFSLMNLLSGLADRAIVRTVPVEELSLSLANTIRGAQTYAPITYKTDTLEAFFRAASILWIIPALALILTVILLYHATVSELRKASLLREDLYEGDMVNTPVTAGIIQPRIILPREVDPGHLEYILLHERVHRRRMDNLWRMVAIIAACIHWFNPLSWVFIKILLNDCELACDEAAVKQLGDEDRKRYAHTLLNYAAAPAVFSSAFGGSRIRLRIERVLTYRRLTWFSSICLCILCLIVAYLLLTNGVA